MIKKTDPSIPVFAADRRKRLTKLGCIDCFGGWQMPASEHVEEVFILQVPEGCNLQFKQCVLSWVHIHGVHVPDTAKEIIQCVATCGSNDQKPILGG
jgi:hypothetical protein